MNLDGVIQTILRKCDDMGLLEKNEMVETNSTLNTMDQSGMSNFLSDPSVYSGKTEDVVIQNQLSETVENIMIETQGVENHAANKNTGTLDIIMSEEVISTSKNVEEPSEKTSNPGTRIDLRHFDEQLMKILGDENAKMAKAFSVTEFFQLLEQKLKNKKQKKSSAERILFMKLKDPDYRKLIRLRWKIKSLVKTQKKGKWGKKNNVNAGKKSIKNQLTKHKSNRTEKENEVTIESDTEKQTNNSRLQMKGAINADHNYLAAMGSETVIINEVEPVPLGLQIDMPSSSKTLEEQYMEILDPPSIDIINKP